MKTIHLFLIALLIAVPALAETIVSGSVDGTWTKEAGPYRVAGDLTVARGTTLRIEPGVDVIFDGPYALTVNGKLQVGKKKGIRLRYKDEPLVTFTTNLEKNALGWGGIRFVNASDENQITNAVIEHARASGDGGGMLCDHTDVVITNTTFLDCRSGGTGGGIAVIQGSVAVTNCTIENCQAEAAGGGVYGDRAEVALTNCTVTRNIGAAGGAVFMTRSEFVSTNDTYKNNTIGGVSLLDKSEGVFTNTTLEGSGIVCRGSELVITNGTISSGDEHALSIADNSEVVITNATLKGGKGLDKDESSEVVTVNVDY